MGYEIPNRSKGYDIATGSSKAEFLADLWDKRNAGYVPQGGLIKTALGNYECLVVKVKNTT